MELYTKQVPNLSHLRVFGCVAFTHLQNTKKLEPKAIKMNLVGYDNQSKAYRCFDYTSRRIVISRDVHFLETEVGIPNQKDPPSPDDDILRSFLDLNSLSPSLPTTSLTATRTEPSNPEPSQTQPISFPHITSSHPAQPDPASPANSVQPFLESHIPDLPIPPRRSSRFKKQNVRLEDYILTVTPDDFDLSMSQNLPDIPSDNITLDEALLNPQWTSAMKDELESISKNNTWKLVPLPSGKKTISARWVFKTKPGLNGQPPRQKARLVARGYEQKLGIDFDEVFAPVVKWSTIRSLAATAASKGHQIHHLDVKTAFLYGNLKEEVFME